MAYVSLACLDERDEQVVQRLEGHAFVVAREYVFQDAVQVGALRLL